MPETLRLAEERALLHGILEKACQHHREAVGAVVASCGDVLAAAADLANKGTAAPVITEGCDTFAEQLDRLRAGVAVLNDRHALVGVLLELSRSMEPPPGAGDAP